MGSGSPDGLSRGAQLGGLSPLKPMPLDASIATVLGQAMTAHDYSLEAFELYWRSQFAARRNSAIMVSSYRQTLVRILKGLPPADWRDLRTLDIEHALQRFAEEIGDRLAPATVTQYKCMARRALKEFLCHAEDACGSPPATGYVSADPLDSAANRAMRDRLREFLRFTQAQVQAGRMKPTMAQKTRGAVRAVLRVLPPGQANALTLADIDAALAEYSRSLQASGTPTDFRLRQMYARKGLELFLRGAEHRQAWLRDHPPRSRRLETHEHPEAPYGLKACLLFWSQQAETGEVPASVAASIRSAVAKFVQTLPHEQRRDLRAIDLEKALAHYREKLRPSVAPSSLKTTIYLVRRGLGAFQSAA